ncbi:TetR/AcrR family transcriptional regulator [Actinoplanes sp. TRM 88003]|uniref:TetR/AcrR family transcriptional regulator n=1 Tax=Paractinoplanes aksuensis TaxID=2939490 RepID=A0ABT1DV42_9ACTN|nr:TetR/AcrR family transcriptional regulator [Actinoplanes aksuensis]MCO8274687.1 TetR/AcrR family transcriptional regulator [Actinoplanes aksuensis]
MTGPELSGTQAAILAAYAELIEEVGSDDVSYRVIARRAGIAERTVFRNYPTRVDLLLATAAWIEATLFAREKSHSIFDIPLAIRDAMHRYDERPELAHVVAETAMRGVSGAAPSPGRAHLEQLLDAEVPSLDAAQRRAIIAALSHLDSAGTWVTFRREFGLDRRDIADAAAWAAEAVLDSIRNRVAPT